jgi:glycosyltransferase involved in cell wall biosynthesis
MGENKMAKKLLSIIVPAYNEQEVLPLFYERLCNCIKPLEDNYDIEIIFTNNASIDKTPDLVSQWHKDDPRVNLITLSRNFGYFSSILSGLTHANGDLFIIIDCDGEDPPELICDFSK